MEKLIDYFRSLFKLNTQVSFADALVETWSSFPLKKIPILRLILTTKELAAILAASGLSMSLLIEPSEYKLVELYRAFKKMGNFREETAEHLVAVANEGWGYTGFESINVGTLAIIIAAAMGIPSVKSGSKKFFSRSGSGDQIRALNVPRISNIKLAKRILKQTNLVFLKGEDFSIVATEFSNMLVSRFQKEKELLAWLTYPLRFAFLFINPLGAKYGIRGLGIDLLDIFNRALIRVHPEIQRNIALIGLNKDGSIIDEATIAGTTKIHVIESKGENLLVLRPGELKELGLNFWNPEDIVVTDNRQGYQIAENLLKGKLPKNNPFVHLVALNAALHCLVYRGSLDFSILRDCTEHALVTIQEGLGWQKLEEYREALKEVA